MSVSSNALATYILSHYGYHVDPIAEAEEKRADLRVTTSSEELIVEVKERSDDFWDAVSEHGEYERHVPIGPNQSEVTTLRKAKSQLISTPSGAGALRMICRVLPTNADYEILRANLYGIERILDLNSNAPLKQCFYFESARLFRAPEVDMVLSIVEEQNQATVRLHPNPFSPNLELVRKTLLCDRLHPHVIDPDQEEDAGNAFVADCWDIPVSDKRARLEYLREKYKRPRLITFQMQHHRYGIKVTEDDIQSLV